MRGKDDSGKDLIVAQDYVVRLPPAPYDACEKVATWVSSLSLVRYRLNDYSVATSYGHRDVLVRGYVHDVVISCGASMSEVRNSHVSNVSAITQCCGNLEMIERQIGRRCPELLYRRAPAHRL
jgi:hypothetical protein